MADAVPEFVTGAPAASEPAPVVGGTAPLLHGAPPDAGETAATAERPWLRSLSVAVVPWVVARVVVLGGLVLARQLVRSLHLSDPAVLGAAHHGLLCWDAGWYAGIAARGYRALPREALRFFPLVPLVARALHGLVPLSTSACLVIVANAGALALGALLHRLVMRESGDRALARRAAWLVALAPPAYVLVMGYAEALGTALAVAAFLALRGRRWWWAALWGVLAGLARPLNVLLALPALMDTARAVGGHGAGAAPRFGIGRTDTGRKMAGQAAAVVAAPAGAALYLAWVGVRFGDALLPLRIQQQRGHRGRLEPPTQVLTRAVVNIAHGRHMGQALHFPWVVLLAGLVVVLARRWPAPYTAYAGAVLLLSLCSANMDSLERYALGAFPFVLAAAWLTAPPKVEGAVLALAAAGLGTYALLAFVNVVVP